jgi:NTP pyrophosphatase (non-canonical NTP hydrolase)
MSYSETELKVIRWAEDRRIIPNSNPKAQAQKTLEEAGELLEAATAMRVLELTGRMDTPIYGHFEDAYKDAVGDVLVTLIIGAALADVDVVECLNKAYDEIKDRTGTMNEKGVFVKDVK